jgi:uncharacterized protein (DUF2062 family)
MANSLKSGTGMSHLFDAGWKLLKRHPITAIETSVNTINRAAPESQKILIVLFDGRPAVAISRLLRVARQVRAHVLVPAPGNPDIAALAGQATNLHVYDDRHTNQGPVQSAIQAARNMGMTHIITLDPVRDLSRDDLNTMAAVIQRHPRAVFIGRSESGAQGTPQLVHLKRSLGNFWYRLQTGLQLDDARSGVYIFPLNVIDLLPLSPRPFIYKIQAPVKAAWAGAEIMQVTVSGYQESTSRHDGCRKPMGQAIRQWIMILHLTMRAITPWPHRKIAGKTKKSVDKVSVIHPLRSIKTLLTENATPWQLCLAAAMGVFLGALPLIAVHTIAILFAAGYFRLNKVAALAASQLCMPPIVPALCIEAGYYLRFGKLLTEISLETIGYQAIDRLLEWFLGALLLGPLLGALTGAVVYFLAVWILRNRMTDSYFD